MFGFWFAIIFFVCSMLVLELISVIVLIVIGCLVQRLKNIAELTLPQANRRVERVQLTPADGSNNSQQENRVWIDEQTTRE
mgnify:CR=1 FL=1